MPALPSRKLGHRGVGWNVHHRIARTAADRRRGIGRRCEDSNVDALAERLGIGSRHLRRLFLQHLGATPIAVAQAQRLLSAKKLIDETTLPLTSIAIASRYGSIRRFNAAFQATYGRSPRELRRGIQTRVESLVPARCNYVFDRPTTTTRCFTFSRSARLPASNTFMATSTAEALCSTARPVGWR